MAQFSVRGEVTGIRGWLGTDHALHVKRGISVAYTFAQATIDAWMNPSVAVHTILELALRSRLIGKPPDSGSGDWRFESSLLSQRTDAEHGQQGPAERSGAVPHGR